MNTAVELKGVRKNYGLFQLQDLSFSVRKGYITGLIGPNGAGKSTLIKLIMGMVRPDRGKISVFGRQVNGQEEPHYRGRIGYVSDENFYYDHLTIRQMKRILVPFYPAWNEEIYRQYIDSFELPENLRIAKLSKGMQMKFALAVAMSHEAELLIMDEPTAGLDPVFRRELLDLLADYIQDETRSILFSTHITTDLDRIADYIVFINKGKLVFDEMKDDVLDRYALIKGGSDLLDRDIRGWFIGLRETNHGFEGLVSDRAMAERHFKEMAIVEKPSLEEIIYFTVKGSGVRA